MSIVDKLKEKAEKAKEELYKTFAKVKKSVDDTIEDNRETIDKVAETVNTGAKKTYEFMQKTDKNLEDAVISMQKAYDDISVKVQEKYVDLKSHFYTGREYDSKKTEEFFADKGKAVLKFGEKTGKELYELAKKGMLKTKEDYHKVIPTKEELETRYAGIGSETKHWLIRSDYENCLEYHAEVVKKLHPKTKHRDEILADIKATASSGVYDLKRHYLVQPGKLMLGKLETVKKYLELG